MDHGPIDRAPVDPSPIEMLEATNADSPFVLLGDHAGTLIPWRLGRLGVSETDLRRHIAVDIGVAPLGQALAKRTGAAFVAQRYSRLVIDCNRDPETPEAIPDVSDGTEIPANRALDADDRAGRVAAVHEPYHAAIAALLDQRARAGRRTVLVALHSFTPVLGPTPRPWTIGVLHAPGASGALGEGASYAARVLAALRAGSDGETIGDNQPYVFDTTDYTVPRHAMPRGLDWVELEIRQDQLLAPGPIARKADVLARVLDQALSAAT